LKIATATGYPEPTALLFNYPSANGSRWIAQEGAPTEFLESFAFLEHALDGAAASTSIAERTDVATARHSGPRYGAGAGGRFNLGQFPAA